MNTKGSSRWLMVFGFALALAGGSSGCRATPEPDLVSVQLKWVHQAQFAGFYLAEQEGFYAEENLAVNLLQAQPEDNVVEVVASGKADFGVAAPELILLEKSDGAPVQAVAVIYRRNPFVFISLRDSGIVRPQDFVGRRVAYGISAELQFPALLANLGLIADQVELVPFSYDYGSFYRGEVDVTYAYANGGLLRILQDGYDVNLIWPSDYGVHLYADTLFTQTRLVQEQPDLVTRFVRATLKGWRLAVEEPERAVEATMEYALEADPALQEAMMKASVPLIHTGTGPIGSMEQAVWQGMHDMMLDHGFLDRPLDLSRAYTMTFLQAIYEDAP